MCAQHAKRQRHGPAADLDAWGRHLDQQAAVVIATWNYAGAGYRTPHETSLAIAAAARARELRRAGHAQQPLAG